MLQHHDPLSATLAALADPTRRGIVERLSVRPATVSELAAPLGMSLPAVVQHLAVLQDSGLIVSRKVGRVRTCQLQAQRLDDLELWLRATRTRWQRNLDRLGELVDRPD